MASFRFFPGKNTCRSWRRCATFVRRDQSDSGFTLLEVLVALAILGLSLSVLLGTFTLALDRVRAHETNTAAQNLAQALLLKMETAEPSEVTNVSGTVDAKLHWRIQVQDYGNAQDHDNWRQRVMQVRVTVTWEDHGRDRSVSLSTLRLLPENGHD